MINLLPYDTKKQIRAARTNVILLRCIVIMGFSVGFLVLACGATYLFLTSFKTPTEETPKTISNSSAVQTKVDSFRANLVTTKSILDQQVMYSDIVIGIAANLPAGSVLSSLSLSDNSFGSTTNLQILARTADIETKLKENFLNSSLFSNFTSKAAIPNSDSSSAYPYIINATITINKVVVQ